MTRGRRRALFFRKNYAAPGPGIDPDAPEKTGAARFFEIIQLECVSLLQLNLLFLVSCIPILTIPPALFAMNLVVRRMVQDQPVDCFYHYRTAFIQHWKIAYPAFLIPFLLLGCSAYGAAFYLRRAADNLFLFLPFMLCSTIFLVTLLASTCLYGILETGKPLRQALVQSVLLGVGKPLRAIIAVFCDYGLLLIALVAFPLSIAYLLLLGFSVPCLLGHFFLRTVLKQYCSDSYTE